MKKGWEMKRLDEVCTFINGKAYNKTELLESGKYPVLRVGNFFTNNHWYYSDLELPQDKYCDNGDLLYAWSASFGPRIWEGEKVIYHYHIWKVIPDEKLITKEFLYLLLDWDTEKIKKDQGTGTTMMHVGKGSMDARVVPIPPLTEQQRIVAILDEAFAAIAKAKNNAEQNLKNAKELFESYLQGVFDPSTHSGQGNKGDGWEEKTLGEVCEFRNGAAHEQHIDEDGKYILVNSKHISSDGEKGKRTNSALSPLYVGDIAFVMSDVPNGKSLAKCFLVDRNDTYTLNQRIGAIRSKMFDDEFLVYQFNRHKYLLSFNNGENQTNLRKNDILNCPLYLPKMEEQQIIVQKLDALSTETKKLEAIYQQKINDLEELKKSVLQKAFNGELKTAKALV
jgi:type I restriction enzyme, S subunit